jgi:multidrug resistance efflux pump
MTFGRGAAVALALGGVLLVASAALSDPVAGAKTAPATVKVERGPFQATVSLKGVFTPAEMTEVVVRPEVWGSAQGSLAVLGAAEQGAVVKKGDVLVTLQTEKIDRAIQELEAELKTGAVALRLAEDELPVLEKTTPLDLDAARRAKQQADEDLEKFLKTDKPLAQEQAERTLKSAKFFVESAREELRQLQKMYRSKDLTEETEEFILKRQRFQVEMAEFALRTAAVHREQTLQVDLPRREQAMREAATRATLALDKARTAVPLGLSQKRLALEKARYDHERAAEKLRHLKKDRELMPVRSPADGIVFYGKCTRGQWNSSSLASKLQRGGTLPADEVFMTIVTPRPLLADATVEEKDLHWLKAGARGKAVPAGFPDVRLPVELTRLSAVPEPSGGFAAVFKVDASGAPEAVVPGMNCTIKVIAYRNDSALTLPASAVFSDDDEDHYVYRPGPDRKVAVRVGKTANDRVEILGGLSEGDAVLASKP